MGKVTTFSQTKNRGLAFFNSSANLFNGKLTRTQVTSCVCRAIKNCFDILIFLTYGG